RCSYPPPGQMITTGRLPCTTPGIFSRKYPVICAFLPSAEISIVFCIICLSSILSVCRLYSAAPDFLRQFCSCRNPLYFITASHLYANISIFLLTHGISYDILYFV